MFVARVIEDGEVFLEAEGAIEEQANEAVMQMWVQSVRENFEDWDSNDEKILAEIEQDLKNFSASLYVEVEEIQ